MGLVDVSPKSHYLWRPAYVGKARDNGQFEIVWKSEGLFRPMPFPPLKCMAEWLDFQKNFFEKWGQGWENPEIEKKEGE
jgi:urea transport system substrate-binding protein